MPLIWASAGNFAKESLCKAAAISGNKSNLTAFTHDLNPIYWVDIFIHGQVLAAEVLHSDLCEPSDIAVKVLNQGR